MVLSPLGCACPLSDTEATILANRAGMFPFRSLHRLMAAGGQFEAAESLTAARTPDCL
jgi:hypothetical protein